MTKTLYELAEINTRLDGGVNFNSYRTLLEDNEMTECVNFCIRQNGLTKRRGIYRRSTASAFNTYAVRLVGQLKTFSVNQIFAAPYNAVGSAGGMYYSEDGGTNWNTVRTTTPTHQTVICWQGLQYNDEFLFFCNDGLRRWGGTADTLTAATGPTGMRGGAEVLDYIFTYVNDDTIRYTDPGAPTTWPAANSFQVGIGDGQVITSIVAYKDRLVIFKNSSIYVLFLTGTPVNWQLKQLSSTVGATGVYAATVAEDYIYFIGREGVYRTNLSTVEEVSTSFSRKFTADRTFSTRSNTQAPGNYDAIISWNNLVLCSINFGAAVGALSSTDRRHELWVWDLENQVWTQWLPSLTSTQSNNFIPFHNFLPVKDSSDSNSDEEFPAGLYMGSLEPNGKTFMYRDSNGFLDDGVGYPALFETKTFTFESMGNFKKIPIGFINVGMHSSVGCTVQIGGYHKTNTLSRTITPDTTIGRRTYKFAGPGYTNELYYRTTFTNTANNASAGVEVGEVGFVIRQPRPVVSKAIAP